MLRRFTAIIIFAVGLIFMIMSFASSRLVTQTIANGRILESQFHAAASKAETFTQQTGKPPSQDELDLLLAPGDKMSVLIFGSDFGHCNATEGQRAALSQAKYILAIWRGEWMECYAPSTRVSTIALTPEAFTLTGSVTGDKVAALLMLMCTFFVAFALWRPKKRSVTPIPG